MCIYTIMVFLDFFLDITLVGMQMALFWPIYSVGPYCLSVYITFISITIIWCWYDYTSWKIKKKHLNY